jgi:SHS2 domain-containing protein
MKPGTPGRAQAGGPVRWELFAHPSDVGVRGRGDTLVEAFAQAGLALTAVVTDPALVEAHERVELEADGPDDELLFVAWMDAIVYAMATRRMLFCAYEVRIEGDHLRAFAWGEPVDVARHQPAAEVKGASYAELKVAREPDGGWVAQTIVDV